MLNVLNTVAMRSNGGLSLQRKLRSDPLLWALGLGTAVFLVLLARHVPCVRTTTDAAQEGAYGLLCYTDIQSVFLAQSMGVGTDPGSLPQMIFSPLLALVVLFTSRIASSLFGAPISRSADLQAQMDSSTVFFGLTAVGLFVCFLAVVTSLSYLGRRVDGRRSWDAVAFAASPVVLAVGLINWDLVPLALTAVGLVLFASRRVALSAVTLGLAASAGTMPIAVIVAVLAATGLRAGARDALRFAAITTVTFLAVHWTALRTDLGRVIDYYDAQASGDAGFGSLWYLAKLWGFEIGHAGSYGFAALLLALGCFLGYLRVTGRRPRVGSLVAVVILAAVILGPSFPPQTSLWVLFAVILARPYRRELVAVTVTQVAYTLAIWGWLDGALTSTQAGPYWLYWLAIIARVAVEGWILALVVVDIFRPARDRMRRERDPIGGVLNDAPTAPLPANVLADGANQRPMPSSGSVWARWGPAVKAAAVAVVVTRIMYLTVGYVGQWLLTTDQVKPEFTLEIWRRWDVFQYLSIAEHGYGPDVENGNAPAFFPLFPLAIRAGDSVGIDPLTAGMLVSAIASFVACVYLYRLAQLHGFDGHTSVLYLLLFPTATFLVAPYTEALFLAGAIPAFYYAYRGRPWPAAVFAAIAVATRTVGLFLVVGVAFELARRAWPNWRSLASTALAMIVATLPFCLFGLHLLRERGSFFAFVTAQKDGWGREFVGFKQGFEATWNTWDAGYGANVLFTWRLEIVFAALSLVLLGWLLWRGYVGYSIYVGATLIIALGNAWYYSTPRIVLAFFPFAFAITALLGKDERRHTYALILLTGIAAAGAVAWTRGAWFY